MLEVSWFGRCKRRGKTGRRKTRVQTAASGKITAQGGEKHEQAGRVSAGLLF
jgi:hypothetical protein